MLSLKNLTSASDALGYYQKVLDYYAGSAEHAAQMEWQGKALQALFGSKKPTLNDFKNLLEGKLPSGQVLGRAENGEIHHRPGIDLTFSAPKSLSILALIYGDKDVIKAHITAVTRTLKLLEHTILQTRIKGEPAPAKRVVFLKFLEMMSRELDPQIHTHCVLLNLCHALDGKFRSLHYDAIYDASMLGGVTYRSFLAIELQKLGYEIEITSDKGTFEIKGVPQPLLDLFSKRRAQIEEAAHLSGRFDAKHMDKLNLVTRKNKTADAPLNTQIEKWKIEAAELSKNLGVSLDKGFEQFRTGPGFRLRDSNKIADEAIQAGIAKLDEFKRMTTKQEIIYEATRLSLGTVLPKAIEKAFERALSSKLILPIQKSEQEHNKRQSYYMSSHNATLAQALQVNAKQNHTPLLRSNVISLIASRWILSKDLQHTSDKNVYKNLIDFSLSSSREMVVDNLCPKVDKIFLTRAKNFASFLGVHLFHVTVSGVDRKICTQSGLNTWSLDYLHKAVIKPRSLLVVHGSEKLLYTQMRDISEIAKTNQCKIIWANDKNIHALDRRLSPVELIAPYLPRASFEVGSSHRLSYDYTVVGSQALQLKSLSQDNFIQAFAGQYSYQDGSPLLSYQKDTVNLAVRQHLIQNGTLNNEGITVKTHVHQYLSLTEMQRPASYHVGNVIRLNTLSLATIQESSKAEVVLNSLLKNKTPAYSADDHFKITAINGSALTLVHSQHHTEHSLNVQNITHFRDLAVFTERSIEVSVGDKLILAAFDTYGKPYQNQIGNVIALSHKAITLKLSSTEKPFVLHLEDKQGLARAVYADYGYCVHPSARLPHLNHAHLDCRATHSINALRVLSGIGAKATLYTDSPQGVMRALASIQPEMQPVTTLTALQNPSLDSNSVLAKHIPDGDLKSTVTTTALHQALQELSAEGKTQLSQWDITQRAMALCVGEADIHDMRRGFQVLLDAGDLTQEGKYYTANWVMQYRDALVQAFQALEEESGKTQKGDIEKKPQIPRLSNEAVLHYIKNEAPQLEKEPIQAIVDITISLKGLSLLQGPAGSAKTSLVLRHVAALFEKNNIKVIGIAPQHSQKDELCKKAGIPTMTLKKFLQLEKSHQLQDLIIKEKTIILVDESSMLSYKEMLDLTHIANRYTIKMVFAGDSQQLDSPRSSQPFLHLQQQEGVQVSTLKKIYRQCAIKRPELHKAIVELTKLKPGEQAKSLVPYLRQASDNKSLMDTLCDTYHKLPSFLKQDTLILTLTNDERRNINERLRIKDGPGFTQVMLHSEDLSTDMRYRAAYYVEGHLLKFNKEIKEVGIAANTYWQIIAKDVDKNLLTIAACSLDEDGKLKTTHSLTINPMRKIFHRENTLEYFKTIEQSFSIGDKIMFTHTIRHESSVKLNTSKQGILKSFNEKYFTLDFGNNEVVKLKRNQLHHAHIDLGYARTYHNAQSLDAACVLMLADVASKMLDYVSNYVGATRCKKLLRIFTQDIPRYLKLTQKSSRAWVVEKTQQPKREIDEAKLLNDLNHRIEQHAQCLFGPPKEVLPNALLYGSQYIKKGVVIITQDKDDAKRGDCLYAGVKLDFVSLIELTQNLKRDKAMEIAAEKLMGNPIEDYYPLSQKELEAREMQRTQIALKSNEHSTNSLMNKREQTQEEKAQREQSIQRARTLYQRSQPAKDTLAQRYLVEHRKIPQSIIHQHPNDIRFIRHNNHPAALFPLRDNKGNIQAVQLVYLDEKTAQKTTVTLGHGENPLKLTKQTLGPMKGASIQIGNRHGTPCIAEGPETGLSVLAMKPEARVHITCSLNNMANAPLDIAPTHIIVCADNDNFAAKGEQSQKALINALKKLADKYWSVDLIIPSLINNVKTDFNDILKNKNLEDARYEFEKTFKNRMTFEVKDFNNETRNKRPKDIALTMENRGAQQKLETMIAKDWLHRIDLDR